MPYSELENWDGRLSTLPSQTAHPSAAPVGPSPAATSTPGLVQSTGSGIAISMTSFNPPSIFTRDGQPVDKDDIPPKSSPNLSVRRGLQSTSSFLLAEPVPVNLITSISVQENIFQTRHDKSPKTPAAAPLSLGHKRTSDEKQDDDDEQAVNFMLVDVSPVPSNVSAHISPRIREASDSHASPRPSMLSGPPKSRVHISPHRPLDELFTPEPEPRPVVPVAPKSYRSRQRGRLTFAHIIVPSLPRGVHKRDYQDGGKSAKIRLDAMARAARNAQPNSLFKALSAGLRHNGGQTQAQVYASSPKRKGKERAVDREHSDAEDNGTIFVRPLKRKSRIPEDDDLDYGSRPLKKRYNPSSEAKVDPNPISVSSSPEIPISRTISKHRPKASMDDIVMDVDDVGPPPERATPTYHAFVTSTRHKNTRKKLWDGRNVEVLIPTPPYATYKGKRSSLTNTRKTRICAKPASQIASTSVSQHELPSSDTHGRVSSAGMAMPTAEKHPDPSISSAAPTQKDKNQPSVQAIESVSPGRKPNSEFDVEISGVIVQPAPQDPNLTQGDMRDTDNNTETNGQIDMDYSFEDSHSGAVPPDAIMSGFEVNQLDDALVASTFTVSPSRSALSPSLNIYSSEGYNNERHDLQSNIHVTITSDPSPFLSGADSVNYELYGTSSNHLSSPWISSGGDDLKSPIEGVGSTSDNIWDGTIDPTLLGGGSVVESHPPSPSPSPPPSPLAVDIHSEVPPSEAPSPSLRASPQPSLSNPPRRKLSQRIPRRRKFDEMIAVDDLDLSAESSQSDESERYEDVGFKRTAHRNVSSRGLDISGSARKSARSAPQELISVSPSRDSPEAISRPITPKRTQKRPGHPKSQKTGVTFCHQCRHSSLVDKMRCITVRPDGRPCGLRFCSKCIEKRYPDLTFESSATTFVCPKCENFCNCTVCARKRGEIYVSGTLSKSDAKPHVLAKPSVRSKPDVPSKPNVRSRPNIRPKPNVSSGPDVLLKPPQNPTKYWGTIYGPSGEKIGAAFVDEDDDNPRVVVPKLMAVSRSTRHPKKRRVFIGMIQDSWRLDDRTVREVVTKGLSRSSARKGKGKQKEQTANWPSSRMYIGRKPPLYTRLLRPVETSSNDEHWGSSSLAVSRESSLTPISSPSPDWPKPDVGESALFGFVPSLVATHEHKPLHSTEGFTLSPNKMAIAINAALGSLG